MDNTAPDRPEGDDGPTKPLPMPYEAIKRRLPSVTASLSDMLAEALSLAAPMNAWPSVSLEFRSGSGAPGFRITLATSDPERGWDDDADSPEPEGAAG